MSFFGTFNKDYCGFFCLHFVKAIVHLPSQHVLLRSLQLQCNSKMPLPIELQSRDSIKWDIENFQLPS